MAVAAERSSPCSARAHTNKLIAALVIPAILGFRVTYADTGSESGPPMFLFSGFGTVGVVHSSEDRADFVSGGFLPSGAGYTHPWSAAVDSLIGGQVVANFTPQFSAMLQVISQQNYDNSYTPHVEWANIKYQFTPDMSVRVGRIVLPSFLVSDTRNIGYANPWVRPPVEVYSLVPIDTNDGVDASYRLHLGQLVQTFAGTYGGTTSEQPAGGNAEAKRQWNLSDTVEYGAVTIHIAYQRADLTIDKLHTFFAAFRQFGPQGEALADKYDPYRKPVDFAAVGGTYDPGDWFVTGEWGTSQTHSALGESTAWYVSGGYRFDRFTPYLTYGDLKANSNRSDPGLMVAALPANLAGPAAGLNAGLNAILGAIPIQSTASMGVRWDFMKGVDLKIQYDHTRLGAGSPGLLINLQPGFQPGGTVNLFSAAVDFVL
jgi:hypothetical protein